MRAHFWEELDLWPSVKVNLENGSRTTKRARLESKDISQGSLRRWKSVEIINFFRFDVGIRTNHGGLSSVCEIKT